MPDSEIDCIKDDLLMQKDAVDPIDLDALLEEIPDHMVKRFHEHSEKRRKLAEKFGYEQLKVRRHTSRFKYPVSTVVSYRSAIAATKLVKNNITLNQLSELHGLSFGYGLRLSSERYLRPECLPDPELTEKWRQAFLVGGATIRALAVEGVEVPRTWDNQQADYKKRMRWEDIRNTFKSYYKRYPQTGIEALDMCQLFLQNGLFDIDEANECCELIAENLYWFPELKPKKGKRNGNS